MSGILGPHGRTSATRGAQGADSRNPACAQRDAALEIELEPERFIDVAHQRLRQSAEEFSDAVEGNGADLFSLGLRIARQGGRRRGKQNLKRMDPFNIRGDWDDCKNASTQPSCGQVRTVIADDHGGPPFVCLGPADRIKVNDPDLPPVHYPPSPSAPVGSQAPDSPEAAHSSQASACAALRSMCFRSRMALCSAAERDGSPWSTACESRYATSSSGRLTYAFVPALLPQSYPCRNRASATRIRLRR